MTGLFGSRAERLAELLHAGARGSAERAAVTLLVDHDHWLHDPGFTGHVTGTDDHRTAALDWDTLATALARTALPGSSEQLAVARIACAIAHHAPVDLQHCLTHLGLAHSHLVVDAIAHASGITR